MTPPQAPLVVVYANRGPAPDPAPSGLMADHLRYAVPLAGQGDVSVSSHKPAPAARPASPGIGSGEQSGETRAILRQFRDQAPARWMAFLHAHFSSAMAVSVFFAVDEKTGRNWWNGVGRPTVDKTLYAEMSFGSGYRDHMLPEAARWAAE